VDLGASACSILFTYMPSYVSAVAVQHSDSDSLIYKDLAVGFVSSCLNSDFTDGWIAQD
jgi:hypothetical protein